MCDEREDCGPVSLRPTHQEGGQAAIQSLVTCGVLFLGGCLFETCLSDCPASSMIAGYMLWHISLGR